MSNGGGDILRKDPESDIGDLNLGGVGLEEKLILRDSTSYALNQNLNYLTLNQYTKGHNLETYLASHSRVVVEFPAEEH